jgi:pimeloyl-ACP methyl ester carboxylesterase
MEFVTIATQDGYQCEGIYWPPTPTLHSRALGVVFVHGWTNWHDARVKQRGFCGSLISRTASVLANAGIPSVLTMNRGFHAPEFFNDCALDFEANIDFLVSRGCEYVVIIGHSLGGAKCAYFAGEVGHPRLKGVVLMSAIPSTYNFEGKEALVDKARNLVEQGEADAVLSLKEGRTIAIHEAATLVRNVDHGYRGTTLDAASKIKVHLLSLAAAGEWSWFQEVSQGICSRAHLAQSVESFIFPQARDHSYSGAEDAVGDHVLKWLERRLG